MLVAVLRYICAAAVTLTLGYTWTVGQSGFKTTNQNLCELWASLPLPSYAACEFQFGPVIIWLLAAALAAVWLAVEIYRRLEKIVSRRHRLLAHWILICFFGAGLGFSGYRLLREYQKSPAPSSEEASVTIVQAAIPTVPAPELPKGKTTDISTQSNAQFKKYVIAYAARMRQFDRNSLSEIQQLAIRQQDKLRAGETMSFEDRVSLNRLYQRQVDDFALAFHNNFLPEAVFLRDEIETRLRREGKLLAEGTPNQLRGFRGRVDGYNSGTELADYLEVQARRLSEQAP